MRVSGSARSSDQGPFIPARNVAGMVATLAVKARRLREGGSSGAAARSSRASVCSLRRASAAGTWIGPASEESPAGPREPCRCPP
jgi:hypothetical protein